MARNILVVEDDADINGLLTAILKKQGYGVIDINLETAYNKTKGKGEQAHVINESFEDLGAARKQ